MKKNILLLAATAITSFIVNSAYAMTVNITAADDLKTNQTEIAFDYDVYYNTNQQQEDHTGGKFEGIAVSDLSRFMSNMNLLLADINPTISKTGKHSTITLSYTKNNGSEIFPASCKSMIAKSTMNIIFSESGCSIS